MQELTINHIRYYILAPVPPFVDVLLGSATIRRHEFAKIVELAGQYPNDPRLIEMVRMGGDASAKVPYLMETGETPDSILKILREIARPHVERMEHLPDSLRATIHLLLSLNAVPKGCETAGIAALLEIDQIQADFVKKLHERMTGRRLARDFIEGNRAVLERLDRDWPRLRDEKGSHWYRKPTPEKAQVRILPTFDKRDRLISVYETCVIVDSPGVKSLQALTPPVLRRPLPAEVPAPATGSADWLIREVGKIGRHFTRALLDIIKAHLAAERVEVEIRNYDLIYQHAQEALREYIAKTP